MSLNYFLWQTFIYLFEYLFHSKIWISTCLLKVEKSGFGDICLVKTDILLHHYIHMKHF